MKVELIDYTADGLDMRGELYCAEAASASRPGVLVFPEAFGLGAHARERARRLAASGYVTLACDLHGGARVIDDLPEVMSLLDPLRGDPPRIRARAGAALTVLASRPEVDPGRIAAIGYCFGGTMALELARGGADIRAAVGFHSGLASAAPQDARNIRAKVLVCIGADDPGITPEQRADFEKEMRAGGVDWQLHLYGGVVHSFTDANADRRGMPDFARYDAKADARSWAAMLGLFAEVLD